MSDPVIHHASTAFNAKFNDGKSAFTPDYLQVAVKVTSSSASTGYGFLGEFPMLKEWESERMLSSLKDHDYTITNKLFESSIKVKRTDFEDNDYGKYAPLFEEMGRNAVEYPDEYIFKLLKEGDKTTCYDGNNFFDTEHPVDVSGTPTLVSNLFADPTYTGEAWYLLDTSRALKPLIWQERIAPIMQQSSKEGDESVFMRDEYLYGVRARGNAGYTLWQLASCVKKELSAENLAEVYAAMFAQKADNGRPLRIKPSLIVVPPSLRQKAVELFEREYLASGESNPNYKLVKVLVSPWL